MEYQRIKNSSFPVAEQNTYFFKRLFSKYPKIVEKAETFLERVAEDRKFTQLYQRYAIFPFACVFIVLFCLALYSESSTSTKAPPEMLLKAVIIQMVFGAGLGYSINYKNYKSKRHFLDTGCDRFIVGIVLNLGYLAVIIYFPSKIWDVLLLLSMVVFTFHGLFVQLVQSQIETKLRFDPTSSNDDYEDLPLVRKDKGIISIIESSAFKITLKNVGEEPWNSKNCVLHRHTYHCCDFPLPHFTLFPGEQIDLIPETHAFEGKCIRVHGFYCFGKIDRYSYVRTFISNEERRQCFTFKSSPEKKEDWCEYQEKIAELLIGSREKDEWENVENDFAYRT